MQRADLERRLRVLGWRPVRVLGRHVEWRHSRKHCRVPGRRLRYPLIVVEDEVLCDSLANKLIALACGRPETR
jgi:hypothetical protein